MSAYPLSERRALSVCLTAIAMTNTAPRPRPRLRYNCSAHIFGQETDNEYYLSIYPHLMTDKDLIGYVHTHCNSGYGTEHNHSHPYGEVSVVGDPWIKLKSKRYDIKGELNKPFKGIEKLRVSLA